jgi:hypothetical protein
LKIETANRNREQEQDTERSYSYSQLKTLNIQALWTPSGFLVPSPACCLVCIINEVASCCMLHVACCMLHFGFLSWSIDLSTSK